ncbi:hypothetical protein SETIT_8G185400v2 [Setaria italica]|uniref:No apical meristem-associated C-terminal domain-containing protein n=1 Tax=Setaria italica TaxID=4555 RepID=A0A368S9C8_SETIT|nr:hypothetical protein SETIT_8G185400v2 [Setaria italica]
MFTTMPPKKAFQFRLKVRNCPKFQEIDKSHKRPRSSKSSTLSKKSTKEEEEGDENASETKRPIGRKEAKQRLKTRGDAGPYKEAIEELILDKKEQKKLREEEKKLKEERWKEKRMIHHQKISLVKEKFMWEQEQRIMFCDVSTLNLDRKTYVLAMRAQNAAQKMAAFNSGFGSRFDGGFESSKGGDVNGASQ